MCEMERVESWKLRSSSGLKTKCRRSQGKWGNIAWPPSSKTKFLSLTTIISYQYSYHIYTSATPPSYPSRRLQLILVASVSNLRFHRSLSLSLSAEDGAACGSSSWRRWCCTATARETARRFWPHRNHSHGRFLVFRLQILLSQKACRTFFRSHLQPLPQSSTSGTHTLSRSPN